MTSNTPKNIFEAVGKSEHERQQTVSKKPLPIEETPISSVNKMLDRCRDLHENISCSLDRIFNSKGITHTQYRNYVSNQQNFSTKDWKMIEVTQKNTEEQLEKLNIITKEKTIIPKEKDAQSAEAKKSASAKSEPKRKPISRRQWLQMH